MPGGHDPRRPVDAQAVVALVAEARLAGVEPDPHAERGAVRPRVPGEAALARRRGEHGVPRLAEGDEERVALRVDLLPVVLGERCPQNPPVVGQHLAVRSRSCFSRRVEPSTSVKRKVTVPLGSSAIPSQSVAPSGGAQARGRAPRSTRAPRASPAPRGRDRRRPCPRRSSPNLRAPRPRRRRGRRTRQRVRTSGPVPRPAQLVEDVARLTSGQRTRPRSSDDARGREREQRERAADRTTIQPVSSNCCT